MSKTITENIEGYLFPEYSKRKLHCLSETYEELARLYQTIPDDVVSEKNNKNTGRKEYLYKQQIVESKMVFAKHLKEISGAVGEVADTVMHVSVPVEHRRKALMQYLKKQGVAVKELVFLEKGGGRRQISMVARLGGRQKIRVEDLSGMLSVFFDRRLIPCLESAPVLTKSFDTFLFEDEPQYTLLSSMSRAVKEDEKISGDNYSVEEQNEGNIVLMIADGMGSGEQACRDSQSVIEFMEKFLEAGFQKEKAFTMVNAAIAAQSQGGNLTTLDLCALNLHTGEAEFIKAGAAPSFRKRGHIVDEITSDTLPLGSFAEVSPLTQSIGLMDGDMLVMLSDGVTDCFQSSNGYGRLKDIISRCDTANPKELSDYLLQYAINCQGGRIRDDMTILVAGIWLNRGYQSEDK